MTHRRTRAMGLALTLVLVAATPAMAADICHQIDARSGWQAAGFPPGLVQEVRSSGFWSVAPGLDPAGTQGHGDADEIALAAPLFPDARHGALLVRFEIAGAARTMDWARFHGAITQAGAFNMNLGQIEFRINEGDGLLADNDGALTVCFRYED